MQRITKRAARKLFAEGKPVIFCPCKCHPYPPFSLGCRIHGEEWAKHKSLPMNDPTLFDTAYNSWAFYNTNYEMGYYAHFYVEN